MSAHAAPADPRTLARPRARAFAGWVGGVRPLLTVGLAAALVATVFEARGGLQLGANTRFEIGADVVAGVAGGAALLVGARGRRAWGAWSLGLFALLAALTAVSILWAVDPDGAWNEANRTLSYLAVFGLGMALVRLAPDRWASLLGAVLLAAVVVSGYALLTKIFPGALAEDEIYARLREPFGYWNAVGLMAALAAPAALWLGTRRTGHGAVSALAFPVLGLLLVTILLAYSRGSLLALGIGVVVWFAVVPLRLRGVAVLSLGAIGALAVALWAFGQTGLSEDRAPLAERAAAGHLFGLLLLAVLAALLAAGLAVGFAAANRAPSEPTRRQLGAAVLLVVALVPVAGVTALALSQRGLGGSISKGWKDLTDPHASTPANTADRLTAVGSVRARYWNEALKIFRDHKVAGVGADGYAVARKRYRIDTLDVRHAHGYLVQTAADLGLVGLGVSLALLAAFLAAAGRTTGLWGSARRTRYTPERVALLTMLAIVVVFGVHSLVDWTWFAPGTAAVALLCAGWLVARGPVSERLVAPAAGPAAAADAFRQRLTAAVRTPPRAVAALAVAALALVGAWQTWQPQRSAAASGAALDALEQRDAARATELVQTARNRDPLSIDPLNELAAIRTSAGDVRGGRRALIQAVHMQPANPDTWLRLAEFELYSAHRAKAALKALGPALYLDPRSPVGEQVFLDAARAEGKAVSSSQLKRSEVPQPADSGGTAAATPSPTTPTNPGTTPATTP
jgi:O-antigen ligase